MQIIETNWGKLVQWGYNCEERLRDLRKTNSCITRHPEEYEEMCARCEEINSKCIGVIEKLDRLCRRNSGKIWSDHVAERYDSLVAEMISHLEAMEDLCIREYPDLCREKGFSYCI